MDKIFTNAIDTNLLPEIFNNAYHGIAIVGLDGKWLLVSKSLCDILGYTEKELLSLSFQDITHKEDIPLDLRQLNQLLKGEIENYKMQKRYFTKNGDLIWAQLSVSLVRDEENKPKYFISQVQDITKRKRKENNRAIIAKVIKEQNQRLLNFSRIITHNLKTHAGNLDNLTKFVEEEIPETSTNESFKVLKQAVQNLQDTVAHLTEIAKFSKYDKSQLRPLNLYEYAVNAIYNIASLAKNNNCEIENLIGKDVKVIGIEAYLDSILLNLLTNAIKYREESRTGHIILKTKLKNNRIVLTVQDNGMGIDLNKHGKKMFSLYQTFHNHSDSTGVGLFITKNQVETIGGRIKVKSKVGKGSKFMVYFRPG
ncbi:sensor histidine kinase [Algibacter luteus]|uniref:sensor histidine kinase n=1 Tax=Algibacter luteus TaxID=1178825 RepID=UPI00259A13CF|nr:sensor histidine kinase [Algibacter luteus]WJJ96221.1 PAS domain S-box protein [Algibacter luteus]